jgi:pyruvate, water dikinase
MKLFQSIAKEKKKDDRIELEIMRKKYRSFLQILENNNTALKTMSDMEEKVYGEYIFDKNYIRECLATIETAVEVMIDNMMILDEENFKPLKPKYLEIRDEIYSILDGTESIKESSFTLPMSEITRRKRNIVGDKIAQLGEMKNKLGLPVPDGFAISTWAYKTFVEKYGLQKSINKMISDLDISDHKSLISKSLEIQKLIRNSQIPEELSEAIKESYIQLKKSNPDKTFAVRSSALGEDTELSFAGQYSTYLNVSEHEIIARYKDVIASKFTPRAIYYYLSHSLDESVLAMSVGCLTMINAFSSGVIYSVDPIEPDSNYLTISAIFGLGEYLVDGSVTPDHYKINRSTGKIIDKKIINQQKRLIFNPKGGTVLVDVPQELRQRQVMTDDQIKCLFDHAQKIEDHYGYPIDIEWSISEDGDPYILQVRPLRIFKKHIKKKYSFAGLNPILSGGMTGCPGGGAGPVFKAKNINELQDIPRGSVLVSHHPFPQIITVMDKISAIVTEVGSPASHMATVAREYKVPTLLGLLNARELKNGDIVTVDATNCHIYQDKHDELVKAIKPEFELFESDPLYITLKKILVKVSKLYFIHPTDPDFNIDNAHSLHDITRYCHQLSMEEMFNHVIQLHTTRKSTLGYVLESEIPLKVDIIFLDKGISEHRSKDKLTIDEIDSEPMVRFWQGVIKEGYPMQRKHPEVVGIRSLVFGKKSNQVYSDMSFAVLSKEFMILSLKMGYHFVSYEALASDDINKNYIKMQFKAGGANLERRSRRIKLINEVLENLGFENYSSGDFLDTFIAYETKQGILDKLNILGRLSMLTKQLDMALSNDAIADWYKKDIMRKLGVNRS